jgi:hypothetical protein
MRDLDVVDFELQLLVEIRDGVCETAKLASPRT